MKNLAVVPFRIEHLEPLDLSLPNEMAREYAQDNPEFIRQAEAGDAFTLIHSRSLEPCVCFGVVSTGECWLFRDENVSCYPPELRLEIIVRVKQQLLRHTNSTRKPLCATVLTDADPLGLREGFLLKLGFKPIEGSPGKFKLEAEKK